MVFLLPYIKETQAAVAVISQMIAPAIFIMASGNLVNSTQARIGRIVDRARALLVQLESIDAPSARWTDLTRELDIYRRRSMHLERAMMAFYGAIATFVLSSLIVGLSVIVPYLVWVPTITTGVGAILLLAGSMSSLFEVRLAAGMLRTEIERGCKNAES
jgi:hypothetical protein